VIFYNRRLATIAKRRWATGTYAKNNADWRELYDGFSPDRRLIKLMGKGARRWVRLEFENLILLTFSRGRHPAGSSAETPVVACKI
jgi:hypothetical protein